LLRFESIAILAGLTLVQYKGQIKDNKRLAFIYKTSTVNE